MYTRSQARFMIDVRVLTLQHAAERFANLARDPLLEPSLRIHFHSLSAHLYEICRSLLCIDDEEGNLL